MRGNNKNLNLRMSLPIEDVVRKTEYAVASDTGRELDAVAIRRGTDLEHRGLESREIACA
jgi:hypothetical protein